MKTLLFLIGSLAFAQSSANIIDSTRSTDWTSAGIPGGIPSGLWSQSGSTIPAGSSAATINTALSGCGTNHYVKLGPGSFTLSAGLVGQNSCVLRGSGADQTILTFTGDTSCNGYTVVACIAGDFPFGRNYCLWTAGYARGATSITITSCGSTTPANGSAANLKVGSVIILDQVDDAKDTGTIWNCNDNDANAACVTEGTGGFARNDGPCVTTGGVVKCFRSMEQVVTVTSCTVVSGHCDGINPVTINPPLRMPNWSATQIPQVWFGNFTASNAGFEDFSVDITSSGAQYGINLFYCSQCWIKGIRTVNASRNHMFLTFDSHCNIEQNYSYQNQAHESQSYGMEMATTDDTLIQNNIFQQVTALTPGFNEGGTGNVLAYNFVIKTVFDTSPNFMQAGPYNHAGGDSFNLYEGNIEVAYGADDIHGTHHFETFFRNFLPGWQPDCAGTPCTVSTQAMGLDAGSRYFNLVANVYGTPGYHTVYRCNSLSTSNCSTTTTGILSLGYTAGDGANRSDVNGYCSNPACSATSYFDPQVPNYALFWANYDPVTAAVRFCGNSSDTGWSTTCSSTSETPTTLASYANPVPTLGDTLAGQGAMPASFYLSSKPSWWGSSLPFPAIGPDVSITAGTNGGVGLCSGGTFDKIYSGKTGTCTGGSLAAGWGNHVAMNPAMNCAINTMGMPVDGSGSVLTFNANTCFSGSSGSSVGGNVKISGSVVIKEINE